MKAVYNISYGVYVLTAKGEKQNGCIINTLMQITSSPVKISVTVNKDNYTTGLIEKSGEFNVSILDSRVAFDVIERFGFASGRDTDKFDGFVDYKIAKNGIAYITKATNAYLSAKVIDKVDNGTHITFFAEVTEDAVLSNEKPITYAHYLENIKPKPKAETGEKVVWVCRICGYVYDGDPIPEDFICPLCKHGVADFERKGPKEEKTETKPAESAKENQKEEKSGKKKYICPVCFYSVEAEENPGKCIICGADMVEETK